MRLDRLTELANFLEKKVEPDWFNMGVWAEDGFTEQKCGTAACAFGWATQCFPDDLELVKISSSHWVVRFEHYYRDIQAAERFFEIHREHAYWLFCPDCGSYKVEEPEDIKLDDVIERIRKFVADFS